MSSHIQMRRGTAAAWTAANPTLSAGEPGLETDTGYMKYGDGATAWVSLGYTKASPSLVSDSSGLGGSQPAGNVLASEGTRISPAPLSWSMISPQAIAVGTGWKAGSVRDGDVVWDPASGQYAFLYSAYDGSTFEAVGIAYSNDLIHWSDYGSNPVFIHNAVGGQPDTGGVSFPQLYWDGTQWHMWYIGFPSTGLEIGTPTIMRATATALVGPWTRQGSVLTPSQVDGTFTVIYRPNVRKLGATFYMFFNCGTAAGHEHIYYATAASAAGPWTVGGKAIDKASITGSDFCSDPCLVPWGNGYVVFFWAGGTNGSLFIATCSASEFPATWHVQQQSIVPQSTFNGARPTFVNGPQGPLLFIQEQASGPITIWGQGAFAPNYSRQQGNQGAYSPSSHLANVQNDSMPFDTTNRGYVARFVPTEDMLVTKFSVEVIQAAAPDVPVDIGIYSGDLTTLLGHTGSTSAVLNATGTRTITLGTVIKLTAGTVYRVALSVGTVGATQPKVAYAAFSAQGLNLLLPQVNNVGEAGGAATVFPLPASIASPFAFPFAPIVALRTD